MELKRAITIVIMRYMMDELMAITIVTTSFTSARHQKIDSCRSSHAPTSLFTSSTAVTPCTAAACSSHSAVELRGFIRIHL